MSKYPCELIEDLLPLYIEDELNSVTKEIVNNHIKKCEDCKKSLREYKNDDIKIEDLKESFESDFPRAENFKGFMKKIKKIGIIICSLVLVLILSISFVSYKLGENKRDYALSTSEVVKIFKENKIYLEKDKTIKTKDLKIRKVKPEAFILNKDKGTLLIYNFDSYSEKENALKDYDSPYDIFMLQAMEYEAKNIFMIFIPSKELKSSGNHSRVIEIMKEIRETVFKGLNDLKESVYKGESENWEGTFKIRYYEHFFNDEDGIKHDKYVDTSQIINYKGNDIAPVEEVDFKYESGSEKGTSYGLILYEGSSPEMGRTSGLDATILSDDDEVTFTIELNGKEEVIKLEEE